MQSMLDAGVATRRAVMASHREAPWTAARRDALPRTHAVSGAYLLLPLFAGLSDADQDVVLDALRTALAGVIRPALARSA